MFSLLAALSMLILVQSVIFMCGKKPPKKAEPTEEEKNNESPGKDAKKQSKKEESDPEAKKKAAQDKEIQDAINKGILAKQDDDDTIKEFKSNWGVEGANGGKQEGPVKVLPDPKDPKVAEQRKKKSVPEQKVEKNEKEKQVDKDKKEKKKEKLVNYAIKKGLMAPQDDNNTIKEFKSSWGPPQENHVSTAPPVPETEAAAPAQAGTPSPANAATSVVATQLAGSATMAATTTQGGVSAMPQTQAPSVQPTAPSAQPAPQQ